jgi:hypothetical protein
MINVCPAMSTFPTVVIILAVASCLVKAEIISPIVSDLLIGNIKDLNFVSENTSNRLSVSKLWKASVRLYKAFSADVSVAKIEFYT